MFDQVMKRSNWVWIYKMGRFAEERRAFLCDLNEQGHSIRTLRNVNRFLLAIAERVNVRRTTEITEVQIVRAARDWVAKSCAPNSRADTREEATKRFVYIAKNWLRFLGKWRDPERNPQFIAELGSFLKGLRDERGYTDQTLSTRASALNLFFEWLGKQGMTLKEVSPQTLAAYFHENKARGLEEGNDQSVYAVPPCFLPLCRTAELVRARTGGNHREPSHVFDERTSGRSELGSGETFDCEP